MEEFSISSDVKANDIFESMRYVRKAEKAGNFKHSRNCRKLSHKKKKLQKISEKGVDKRKPVWYIKKAVSHERFRAVRASASKPNITAASNADDDSERRTVPRTT
ncbi:MAG: hypothetical protein J6E42_08250, partial [Firmicutes bacterium]|nr:hypothetical protein [Bacillota bacterium]